MGAVLSLLGNSYAAIGGTGLLALSNTTGTMCRRKVVVDHVTAQLEDTKLGVEERANALVLLEALGSVLSHIEFFIFVDRLTCAYSEVSLDSTALEALARRNPQKAVVRVGTEFITLRVPGTEGPIMLGADALWLKYDSEGVGAAGAFLKSVLAKNGIVDAFVYCETPTHDAIPGTTRLSAVKKAELFDAVVRENLLMAEAASPDNCVATYSQGHSSARWIIGGKPGFRAHGTSTASVLLTHMDADAAKKEFFGD